MGAGALSKGVFPGAVAGAVVVAEGVVVLGVPQATSKSSSREARLRGKRFILDFFRVRDYRLVGWGSQ